MGALFHRGVSGALAAGLVFLLAVPALAETTGTEEATATPSAEATDEPTAEPTEGPTVEPTAEPTDEPTEETASPQRQTETSTDEPNTTASSGSSQFRAIRIADRNPPVVARGSGWGHSVGMSQYGAYAQAQAGRSYFKILKHYYTGIRVPKNATPSRIRVGLYRYGGIDSQPMYVTAVSDSIRWRFCTRYSNCKIVAKQAKGATWKVQRRVCCGGFHLSKGGKLRWKGGGDFGTLTALHHRTVIKAANPNNQIADRVHYRWGNREFRVNPNNDRAMFVVQDIPGVDQYLRGLGEVPSSWGVKGPAALRAQAVAGRTYAVRRHAAFGGKDPSCFCSLGATPAHQVYIGYDKETAAYGKMWVKAVRGTSRRVARYDGDLIETLYSSSHGRRSENVEDSWAFGSTEFPYLRSVGDRWSMQRRSGNPYRYWARSVRNASFSDWVSSQVQRVTRVRARGRTDGRTPKRVKVWSVDTDGKRRTRTVDGNGSKPIAGVDLRNTFGLLSQQIRRLGFPPFHDEDGSYHELNIVRVNAAGVMEHCSRGTIRFCPGKKVTKGQLAELLVNLLDGLDPVNPRDSKKWNDVPYSHPYAASIAAVYESGLMSGCGGGDFCRRRKMTRGLLAQHLVNAVDGLNPSSKRQFDDVGPDHPHFKAINAMRVERIMPSGCGGGDFCPARRATRAQAATWLYRVARKFSG